MKAVGGVFAWMPGCAFDELLDYSKDVFWEQVGKVKWERVMEAVTFLHAVCTTTDEELIVVDMTTLDKTKKYKIANSMEASGMQIEWKVAYNMHLWPAYPER